MSAGWLASLAALSGLCGLSYEVLWSRLLGIEFGISSVAVAITVSAFMLGLAAGSAAATQRALRTRRPLRVLAGVEAAIAVYALAMPLWVRLATPSLDAAAAALSPGAWHALMMAAGFLLLTLPAAAMGFGFPLMVEAWVRRGRSLGSAYGSNTLGAAWGALLPLGLLPALTWTGALRAVALLNLLVAAGLFVLDGGSGRGEVPRAPAQPADAAVPAPRLLAAYAILGTASLVLEMVWLRLFGLAMLRTEYVLALILAVMLTGMGIGSLMAARGSPAVWLRALPWCACGFALVGLWAMPHVSSWLERNRFDSLTAASLTQALLLAALTLPVTVALGAWLPVLVRAHRSNGSWFYAANAAGGALGGLAFALAVPLMGSTGLLAAAALLLLCSGLVLGGARRDWFGVPALLAVAAWLAPMPPVRAFLPQAMAGSQDLYRYEDAIAITDVVEQVDGQRVLLTDLRRQDASSDPTAVFVQENQARLALLLHPAPRSVLFLGVGTGISIAGSLPFPGLERSAVELSAGSIEAARRYFVGSNRGVMQATHVDADDARHFLMATTRTYDVIVGDVFHPDIANAGSLLAVEQFERVRSRLAPGGLYVQWLALNQLDTESLELVLRSFRQIFPEAQLFLDGMHLGLVGPSGPWRGAAGLRDHLERLSPAQRDRAEAGEGDAEWLGRYFGPIVASAGLTQHDWAPVLEFALPRLHYDPRHDAASVLAWLLARRPGLDAAAGELHVAGGQHEAFKRAFIGTELWVRSELANSGGSELEADRLLGLAFEADPQDRWIAYAVSDRLLANIDAATARGLDREAFLRKILAINPWSVDAWRALWSWQRAHHEAGAAASRARMLELSPLDLGARASAD